MTTTVRYEPRGGARELFHCRTPEVIMDGPAGTGKSLSCLFRLHLACLNTSNVRALVVRKTATSLTSTTLETFESKVAGEALKNQLVRFYGGSPHKPPAYRYPNHSTIVIGGMDKPEKILSSEYDLVFVDEVTELTETDWEVISTRLRNGKLAWQQQIGACNPGPPHHWLRQRMNHAGLTWIHSRHTDNPLYVNGDGSLTSVGIDYMERLNGLTGVRLLRLRDGIWAAAEGIVYEQWDEAKHLIDTFVPPLDWQRWWSVDFGYTNPFVLQCWAEDPDGRLFLYRELYRTNRIVEDHAADILSIVAPEGEWIEPKPVSIICDHDAEGRVVLERALGISTKGARKQVRDGIQAVQKRMAQERIFIMRDCVVQRDQALVDARKPTCTSEEIGSYIWATGNASVGNAPREEPIKNDDHGVDAMRYIVAERDLGSRPRVRIL